MAEQLEVRTNGPRGPKGWTPVFLSLADGARKLIRITDWAGGQAPMPATGFIGAAGLTDDVADATDFAGRGLASVEQDESANLVLHYSDGTQAVIPAYFADVLEKAAEVVEKYEDFIPKQEDFVEKYEDFVPKQEDFIEKYEDFVPKQEDFVEKYEDFVPKQEDFVEKYEDFVPKQEDFVEKYEDFVPKQEDFIEKYEDFVPKQEDFIEKYEDVVTKHSEVDADAQAVETSRGQIQGWFNSISGWFSTIGTWYDNINIWQGQVSTNKDLAQGARVASEAARDVALAAKGFPMKTVTTATYTLTLADAWMYIRFTYAGPITVTLPAYVVVAWPAMVEIILMQAGAGQITLVGGNVSVVLNSPETLKTAKQYAVMAVKGVAQDVYDVTGNLQIA